MSCTGDYGRYNYDGDQLWRRNYYDRGYVHQNEGALMILGKDKRLWLYNPMNLEWKVHDPDGRLHKSGTYPDEIYAACVGTNGRLYVANKMTIYCYEDWDQYVWSRYMGQYLDDMVMDIDNHLYVAQLYTFRDRTRDAAERNDQNIFVLNPDDGTTIAEFSDLGVNTDILDYINEEQYESVENSFLAIGDDGKLAFLHRSGLLQVYHPILRVWSLVVYEFES
jgi:hypothetical protein